MWILQQTARPPGGHGFWKPSGLQNTTASYTPPTMQLDNMNNCNYVWGIILEAAYQAISSNIECIHIMYFLA